MSEYGVKIKSDLKPCNIYAICELPSRETLILDYNNDEVKLFDKKYKLLRNCKVLNYSYDMCLISPNELVVTTNKHDDLHFLQMITVRNDKLEKGNKIQLPHSCVGIARHEGDLYVTSGRALYQYTLTGTLVKKLYEYTTGDDTVYSCAVNLKDDKIYVTNQHTHQLLTLAMDGTVISTFTDIDFKGPRGVHVTTRGQVLVCGDKSNALIQVDNEGKKKLATLATKKDGVNDPRSVLYSSSTESVIMGFSTNDTIMVFKVAYSAEK